MPIFINKTMMKILLYCISSAFKIDYIYVIFLQVFDVSCFDLGGSIEPLDPPQVPGQFTVINPSHIDRKQVLSPPQLLINAELTETAEC